jgi:hypothetical protein
MNKASQDMFEAPTFFPDHPKLLPFVVFGTAHSDHCRTFIEQGSKL